MKNFILGAAVALVIVFSAVGGAVADRLNNWSFLNRFVKPGGGTAQQATTKVESEDDYVSSMLEKAGPAVVTVGVKGTTPDRMVFDWNSMGFTQQKGKDFQQDIGSGFIVDAKNGLIVTNKHVVDQSGVEFQVFTVAGDQYKVTDIYKDPVNDLSVIKIDPSEHADKKLTQVTLGDSDKLKVGQKVIAIGTALGEFRNTVTTGVVSGLGRGITATDALAGVAEKLDNLIQTDAAINPGNSGGPLLNIDGQVIGVDTAVAQAQGIGFAIPVNVIKEALDTFNKTGQFDRAFLGVEYKMIDKQTAVMNDLPQGAYVASVVKGSPADKAGIQVDDIIVSVNGTKVSDSKGGLSELISKYKIGDMVKVELYRGKNSQIVNVTLAKQSQ